MFRGRKQPKVVYTVTLDPSEPSVRTLGSPKVPQFPHLRSSIHFADKMVGILGREGPGCQRNLGVSLWKMKNFNNNTTSLA